MSYAMEEPPSDDKPKGAGRPVEKYTLFLKSLYKGADKKQISSLNVFRCENAKKSIDDINDYIDCFKKKIKHLEYILYEKKMSEYATMQPPTIE